MKTKNLRLLILFIGLLGVLQMLAGCGGGSSGGSAASPPTGLGMPPTASGDAWQGRYVGTVKIGGIQYYGDALLTADGAIRLYVGMSTTAHSSKAHLQVLRSWSARWTGRRTRQRERLSSSARSVRGPLQSFIAPSPSGCRQYRQWR